MKGVTVLLLSILQGAHAYYLPGTYPQEFLKGDTVAGDPPFFCSVRIFYVRLIELLILTLQALAMTIALARCWLMFAAREFLRQSPAKSFMLDQLAWNCTTGEYFSYHRNPPRRWFVIDRLS